MVANQAPRHHRASLGFYVLLIIALTVNMTDAITTYIGSIYLNYKSHYTPAPYLTMYLSEQICQHFCSGSCFVGCVTFALWDLLDWSILKIFGYVYADNNDDVCFIVKIRIVIKTKKIDRVVGVWSLITITKGEKRGEIIFTWGCVFISSFVRTWITKSSNLNWD